MWFHFRKRDLVWEMLRALFTREQKKEVRVAKLDATCTECGKQYVWWAGKACSCDLKKKQPMTPLQAVGVLKWHADHSTQGNLADSCKHDSDWETAYRTIFGQAPTYAELMRKIESAKK